MDKFLSENGQPQLVPSVSSAQVKSVDVSVSMIAGDTGTTQIETGITVEGIPSTARVWAGLSASPTINNEGPEDWPVLIGGAFMTADNTCSVMMQANTSVHDVTIPLRVFWIPAA